MVDHSPSGCRIRFTGDFMFCRLAFRASYGGFGGGWGVDYPRADENLSIRLSELSETAVNFDKHGTPNYIVIQATEPELFKCPFLAVTNHGRASSRLRKLPRCARICKRADSCGQTTRGEAVRGITGSSSYVRFCPASDYPLVDLAAQPFDLSHFVRCATDPANPEHRLLPRHRRIYVRTRARQLDAARVRAPRQPRPHRRVDDAQHRFRRRVRARVDDPEFFYKFSVEGYAIGINVLLYAMTH